MGWKDVACSESAKEILKPHRLTTCRVIEWSRQRR